MSLTTIHSRKGCSLRRHPKARVELVRAGLALSALLFCFGCGENTSSNPLAAQQAARAEPDPVAEFEWGIERLKRALRVFRPRGGEGVAVTDRNVDHELFPPQEGTDHYTAKIVITSETAFIHGKRALEQRQQPESKTEKSLQDDVEELVSNQPEADAKLIDLKNVGSQAPDVPAVEVDTRSMDNQTVLELSFLEGRWQLTNEPRFDYEKEWFKYAFE